jgi:hypothetical protein
MNEIFNNYSPSNACKIGGSGGDLSCDTPCDPFGVFQKNKPNNMRIDEIDENMVQYIAQVNLNDSEADAEEADADADADAEADVITFAAPADAADANTADAADAEADIDKMVDTIISSSEEYEKKASIESNDYGEHNEADNVSVCSEITFTSEDKKNERTLQKKYSKMSLEKLKELCISNKVNSDGTKNQLITRLIDVCNK